MEAPSIEELIARRCCRPRLRRWLAPLAVGAAILHGGCSRPLQWARNGFKVGPNYCKPLAPVAPEWIYADDPRVASAPPRDGDWWNVFQDPTLNGLVCRAYRQNLNLRSIGTRVLQARAQQAIAVGNVLPQNQQVLGLYPSGVLGKAPNHIDVTAFNLSWELDFWGKYRRQIETANARLDASVESYDDALVTLLADVATNYVQYRVAQQQIKIAEANLQTQEKLVALAEQQEKVGTANIVDVEQLRTLMEQTRSSIPAFRITQGQANDRLCILMGEPPRDLEAVLGGAPQSGTAPLPTMPIEVDAGVPSDLLLRRPDVRNAERLVAAQSPQIGVAKADLLPSLSIGTTLGYGDIDLGPALATSGGLAFITPQFSWKILNYGRLLNNIRLQDARTQELVASYQNKVLTAAQEVQTALRGFLRSQEQAEALASSAAAALEATDVQEKLFTDVKADVNRLFTLENSKLQQQQNLAVAQGNIALNLINVYRALGGGWDLRLHPEACDLPAAEQSHETVPAEAVPEGDVEEDSPVATEPE